ncbi:MAG: prolyl aminopeptidase [Hyphomicrobiaceae bacterium]|nr:MAG: prolyl aminopeptidase [Hyphomicrobiaceae bacterium]
MQHAAQSRLHDAIEPYAEGELDVGHGHKVHWETCGNPHGIPVAVLHGGPGGGSNPTMRQFHDPARYRIVLFDQRGSGRSTPHASVEHNTTWDLVEDMERLRRHLGIERWQLFGGSWGSTLALAYAQKHPERVTGLILRGVFLLRRPELLWFYQDGASWLFPDAFAAFSAPIPPSERGDMIGAYYKRLMSADRAIALAAARAWSVYEGSLLSLVPDPQRVERFAEADYALAFARIECHYFVNRGFFDSDDQLLRDANRLSGIPGVIVHGRYDVVTPIKSAFDLKAACPAADLRIVPDAGHAMSEAGIIHELVSATRRLADT